MTQVIGGRVGDEASLIERSNPDVALRRVFESEETGLFHMTLDGERPVRIGHEQLVSLVLCLDGKIVVSDGDDEAEIDNGSYAIVHEGQSCMLAARGAGAEALVFFGLEQLPGAFFNSYGPANV